MRDIPRAKTKRVLVQESELFALCRAVDLMPADMDSSVLQALAARIATAIRHPLPEWTKESRQIRAERAALDASARF